MGKDNPLNTSISGVANNQTLQLNAHVRVHQALLAMAWVS